MRALAATLLLALALAGAGLAALPWLDRPVTRGDAVRPAPPALPEIAFAPPGPPPATDLSAFLARPLFSAARRPPPPEAPGLPITDPNAGLLFRRYEIAGVVKLGSSALAMLRDLDGRLIRLREGESVDTAEGPATLLSVDLNALTFRHRGATVVAPVRREGAETE